MIVDQKDSEPTFGELLSNISVSKTSFNPSQNDTISVSYNLSKPGKTSLRVYDADLGLVKIIDSDGFLESGPQSFAWDGKDLDGRIVPDEAYFFIIYVEGKSGDKEVYDPTLFSGGVENDITTAQVDPQTFTINYIMPEIGRVMIRMGIQGGPLMNQLVDWKPRVKGAITEYWDGKDKDRLINIYQNPKFKMIITYFTLPENSVITIGNRSVDFRTYKTMVAERPQKDSPPQWRQGLSPHYPLPRTMDYSPSVSLSFSNSKGQDENGLPVLNEKTVVKVSLDDKDKSIFQNSQFEICFYLNQDFYAEDESGYTPFNWVWDLSDVEEGEHLLTVNISSFKDQIGVVSRKVKVVK
ncbi:hypothetical protein DSCOOX_07170 [Desulfosarcina ovata subsp. ovata]|uniref:FlgD Ig-like domain-containing protein n=1 Tax=Desulfosarcina ovata subsp. ovata TaxID=2752305 RepID=A0A5K8A4Z2_9BACT|nr:hypothetical protein DSCOOX_07170 [Desulfosarcina ovata subsp. ovata]